ncbi:hypothetical protein Tco_0295969 [Tanacetum coccineum]
MHQPWRTFATLINKGLSGKTSGLDKLRLSRAQILWGMFYQKNVDYVELLWEDFIHQIENRVYKKQEKMYYPRFTKAIIHHFLIQEKLLSWRNKIGMHTSKDDYLINSLRFVSAKESTQIYGAILPECLTSSAMKESKAYKTYLGYATGVVPPKMARKFKKTSPSKKDSGLILVDEEPIIKGKRVKRPAKKFTTKPASGVVIREALFELLSEVAVDREAQMKEVPDVTEDDSTESESESWGNDEDDSNNDQDSKQEEESEDDDQEAEGDKEIFQGEGADAEMIDAQQGNENLETTQEQVVEDGHVTISTIMKKTEVPVTSSSRSSELASKFLNFLDIPHTDAEIVSPLDVYVHLPRTQAPTLLTIPVSVITKSSPVYTSIPQSSQIFTPPPILTTPNTSPTIETTNPLSTLLDFASVF